MICEDSLINFLQDSYFDHEQTGNGDWDFWLHKVSCIFNTHIPHDFLMWLHNNGGDIQVACEEYLQQPHSDDDLMDDEGSE